MRRTVLSAIALACTAVLASTVPAFADGTTPTAAPSTAPSQAPSDAAPSAEPSQGNEPSQGTEPTVAPTPVPGGEVSVVPSGAPDTGEVSTSTKSGSDSGLIAGGTAAAFAVGGAAFFVVRRRRATGE
ncbi:sortase-dependent protein [Streptomyces phaeochromogenes]|uniref:sortase-dependent protein n=1 Tax=Streptomyces phaeochromogenes TaxID=1923 RepID=UPI0036CB7AEC